MTIWQCQHPHIWQTCADKYESSCASLNAIWHEVRQYLLHLTFLAFYCTLWSLRVQLVLSAGTTTMFWVCSFHALVAPLPPPPSISNGSLLLANLNRFRWDASLLNPKQNDSFTCHPWASNFQIQLTKWLLWIAHFKASIRNLYTSPPMHVLNIQMYVRISMLTQGPRSSNA